MKNLKFTEYEESIINRYRNWTIRSAVMISLSFIVPVFMYFYLQSESNIFYHLYESESKGLIFSKENINIFLFVFPSLLFLIDVKVCSDNRIKYKNDLKSSLVKRLNLDLTDILILPDNIKLITKNDEILVK